MRRLLALLALLPSLVWAGDCTVSSIGAGFGGGSAQTFTMPATIVPGDALVLHSSSFSATATVSTAPTGYTLLKEGSSSGVTSYIKIAGRSESDPGLTWSTGSSAGYIVAIHNSEGFPAAASILGDSATATATQANMSYGALSVTQGGECAFQLGRKNMSTGATNAATSVALTSGYTACGFAARNTNSGVLVACQFFTTDATSPDLAVNTETISSNTDSASNNNRSIALTLLSGDKVPADLTAFTDVTGATVSTNYEHAALGLSAFDNWTDISVTGDASCAVNPGNTGWVTSGYINVAETYKVHVDSSSSPNTAVSCVVTIGTKSDTFTVTTAAGDTTPDAYSWTGDVTLQALSSASDYSNIVTIAGLDVATPAAITVTGDTGCAYSKNGAAATSNAGTVVNDDTVKLRVTTSAASATATTCQSTIGGVDGTSAFTATTADFVPAAYDTFTDVTGIVRSATACSDAVALSGLTGAAAVSVDVGTCRVNSAGYTGLTCGTAGNTDTVQMCHTASASYATATTQTMSIGPTAVTAAFQSTTESAPSTTENPLIVTDLFTGSNGTAIGSHTPSLDVPAHGWVKVGAGVAEIQSNRLSLGQSTYASIDTDATILQGDVDWIIPASSAERVQVVGRFTDDNNKVLCDYNEDADQVLLRKRVSGTVNTLVTTSVAITDNATHSIGLALLGGDQLVCLLDGVKVNSAVDTAFNTIQGFAVYTNTGTGGTPVATFDNLRIKHAYQGVRSDTLVVPDDPLGLFQGETLDPLTYYWASTPYAGESAHPPAALTFYEGASWYENPEVAYVGDTVQGWSRWNPQTSAIETGTLTYTTQGVGLTVAVWQAAAIGISLPIGVPASIDFTQYLTTRGVLAAVCSSNSDIAGMSFTDPANCVYSGTPTTGYTAPQSKTITATNASGAPTKAAVFTITGDDVPNFPAFTPVVDATPSASAVESDTVTLTQTNVPYAITVAGDTGCKYVKDGGAAASSATTGVSGTTLALQVDAGLASVTTTCTATAGGISQAFTVTAAPAVSADVDDFTFPTLTGVALSSAQSACITVTGNTAVAAVTVSGGTCTINGDTCPANMPVDPGPTGDPEDEVGYDPGGNEVCALHTASAVNNTPTNTVVTISGKVGTFTSVTLGASPVYVPGCIVDSEYELLVGDSLSDDLSSCWTGADSITILDMPPDSSPGGECNVSGALITCDAVTTEGIYTTTVVVSNSYGTDIRYIYWDIQESDVTTPPHPHPPYRRVRH